MEQLTILEAIGGGAAALITIITLLNLIIKKPKAMLRKEIQDEITENNKQITEKMDESNTKVLEALEQIERKQDTSKQASLAALRHEITEIYDTYCPLGYLPTNIKKDLMSLYDAYSHCGGNSFITELYLELKDLPSNNSDRTS